MWEPMTCYRGIFELTTSLAVVKYVGSLLQLSFNSTVCDGTFTIHAVPVGFWASEPPPLSL